MTVEAAQLGFAEESTYGTPVTVTKFFEFDTATFDPVPMRDSYRGHRKNQLVERTDRFSVGKRAVTGAVSMPIPTKSFGIIGKHGFGSASISAATDSNYTQTWTLGSLTSRYLTGQMSKPLQDGTAQPHTYHGLKIASLEFVFEVDKVAMCNIEFDGEDEDTSTSLATASYASSALAFPWPGTVVTVGGSSVECSRARVRIGNPMNVNRHRLGSRLKKNPLSNELRVVEWELAGVDHSALTQYNRVVDTDRADTLAEIVITATAAEYHAGTTYPQLALTIPAARFDRVDGINITSYDELTGTYSGIGMDNGSNEPITGTYRTTDSAVV